MIRKYSIDTHCAFCLKPFKGKIYCEHCGCDVLPKFCRECGCPLNHEGKVCSQCGYEWIKNINKIRESSDATWLKITGLGINDKITYKSRAIDDLMGNIEMLYDKNNWSPEGMDSMFALLVFSSILSIITTLTITLWIENKILTSESLEYTLLLILLAFVFYSAFYNRRAVNVDKRRKSLIATSIIGVLYVYTAFCI